MSVVLDASAVLALLQGERGAKVVEARLQEAAVSAVNASEVVAKMVDRGLSPKEATASFQSLMLPIVSFVSEVALQAGELRAATRRHGLSLGDRACLAEARAGGHTVLTTDRAWAGLDLGIPVEVIR